MNPPTYLLAVTNFTIISKAVLDYSAFAELTHVMDMSERSRG